MIVRIFEILAATIWGRAGVLVAGGGCAGFCFQSFSRVVFEMTGMPATIEVRHWQAGMRRG